MCIPMWTSDINVDIYKKVPTVVGYNSFSLIYSPHMILLSRLKTNAVAKGEKPVLATNALADTQSAFQFYANVKESAKKINPLTLKKKRAVISDYDE